MSLRRRWFLLICLGPYGGVEGFHLDKSTYSTALDNNFTCFLILTPDLHLKNWENSKKSWWFHSKVLWMIPCSVDGECHCVIVITTAAEKTGKTKPYFFPYLNQRTEILYIVFWWQIPAVCPRPQQNIKPWVILCQFLSSHFYLFLEKLGCNQCDSHSSSLRNCHPALPNVWMANPHSYAAINLAQPISLHN